MALLLPHLTLQDPTIREPFHLHPEVSHSSCSISTSRDQGHTYHVLLS